MNWQQALRDIGIKENNQRFIDIANTPVYLLKKGVVLEDVKKEDESIKTPNNNTQNMSNSRKTKTSEQTKNNTNIAQNTIQIKAEKQKKMKQL